jgi:hypothetical protein
VPGNPSSEHGYELTGMDIARSVWKRLPHHPAFISAVFERTPVLDGRRIDYYSNGDARQSASEISGQVVFVAYGVTAPDFGIDEHGHDSHSSGTIGHSPLYVLINAAFNRLQRLSLYSVLLPFSATS